MTNRIRTLISRLPMLAIAAFVVALVAPHGASARPVSGTQVAVDEPNGEFKMKGDLKGAWLVTSFEEIGVNDDGIYEASGTEEFDGCLDRNRNRSCAGDPSGTLEFEFLFWARFGPEDELIWGACYHPVTGGTGDFAGADGVLTMSDAPTANGVKTSYTGTLALDKSRKDGDAANRPAAC